MVNEYIILAFYIGWGILVFVTICFLISGLDDLLFDLLYWGHIFWRKWKFGKANMLSYQKWISLPEQRIAVMIPCWHEAGVIEVMLKYNVYSIDYHNYDLFVGVYSNDPKTVESVKEVEKILPHIKCVVGPKPGPTNKASNLNAIYKYIGEYEKENHIQYDIFVLHDSEDIIHSLSFKLYNFMIPKKAMVQLPVFPLDVPLYRLTHWVYAAEFSEAHTKDLVVRELIGGLVPSAGVGTGFSREVMEVLKASRGGEPFATNTLTEDYSTALQIRVKGLSEVFVMQYIFRTRWRKRWYFFGPIQPFIYREYIATRAMFPTEYMKSVRQKSRWILGIGFEEWINTGWIGNLSTLYTLLHDRKSLFSHFVTGIFFLLTPFMILYHWYINGKPDYPNIQDMFDQYPWVWKIILFASSLMLIRMVERTVALYKIYGFFPALMTIPLIIYGNFINLHALLRAYNQFIFAPKSKSGSVKWDKTDHEFPAQRLLIPYKFKMGNILVQDNIITREQLQLALKEQNRTGQQLGHVLLGLGYLTEAQLAKSIAKQYGLEMIKKSDLKILSFEQLSGISPYTYDRMMHANVIPIALQQNHLTVAIPDPSNEVLLAAVMDWVKPYLVQFKVIDKEA